MKEMEARLEQQVRVSKMLGLGFILSITPMGGVGSLLAFILGFRALHIIQKSGDRIAGLKMALWCVIAGAYGMVIIPLAIWAELKFPRENLDLSLFMFIQAIMSQASLTN